MKLRLALAAATCLALPLAAHVQPVTGPYIAADAGTTIQNPWNFQNYGPSGTSGKLQMRESYSGDVAVGYGFGNGFRVELNGEMNRNTIAKVKYNGYGDSPLSGGVNTYGPMVNALYDMNIGR